MEFINSATAGITAIITVVVLGIFSLINILDKRLAARRKEADAADEKLIGRLKELVEAQGEEIETLKTEAQKDRIEMAKVLKENEVLTRILQGRDERTIEYQKAGLASMELSKQTHELVVANNKTLTTMVGLLERHLQAIEKKI